MKFLVLIAIALGAAFFYPARHEQAPTQCAALEKRLLAALPPGQARLLSQNANAGGAIHDMVPFLPPEAGCAVAYWLVLIKPDLGDALRAGMLAKPSAG